MWYVSLPGVPRTVLGVYDHPADPDVPGLKSLSVGSSWPTDVARGLTSFANKAADLLDSLDPLP